MPIIDISRFIVIGDSLSDRGQMASRKELFGIVSMNVMSGLFFKSSSGRFTNGAVWSDFLAKKIIGDSSPYGSSVHLDDPDEISAPWSTIFMRTYCEGGLTACDYSGIESLHLINEITQEILSSLNIKRKILLQDDLAMGITPEQKKSTLVIEWSGANDLITVNSEPTLENAEKAVTARIENAKELIKSGYRNFVLFNLPDLSLTPRFQNGEASARDTVQDVSIFFNRKLAEKIVELQVEHPECSISIHDVNSIFTDAYNNTDKFGLEVRKLRTPFVNSDEFDIKAPSASGRKYMFWDDVHPTEIVHELLEETFYKGCFKNIYKFIPPVESWSQQFIAAYGQEWEESLRQGCCCTRLFRSPSFDYKKATFLSAFEQARKNDGITRMVMEKYKMVERKTVDIQATSSGEAKSANRLTK